MSSYVEDNLVNQQVAILLLGRLGYQASVSLNGAAALEVLKHSSFDVVLMDIQMPEMDGYEATRQIRAQLSSQTQPYIIAMTANALRGDREKCLAVGMNDYISKPVRLEDLSAALALAESPFTAKTPAEETPVESLKFLNGISFPQLDPTALAALAKFGGKKVLIEVFDIFVAGSTERYAEIDSALARHDFITLEREFHSTKSTAKYLGASQLVALSDRLERIARNAHIDEVNQLISEFLKSYQLVLIDVQAALKTMRG